MRKWTVDDVMTGEVVSVAESASYREVVDLLTANRFSAVPVVDAFRHVTGVVSEADLLRKIEYLGDEKPRLLDGRRRRGERHKALARTAADLMTAPPVVVLSGTSIPAVARQLDRAGVKRMPVVDDLGRIIGIVTRGDLLKTHLRPDDEIRRDVERGVVGSFLLDDTETVTVAVSDGVVTVTGRVDRWSAAEIAVRLIREIPGVVEVSSTLEYGYDDRGARGVPAAVGLP
jgi:CBS domain-containing protein